jgi:hypothetical protein
MHPAIPAILADVGAMKVADHTRFRSTLSRLAGTGVLENPLPGTYAPLIETEEQWLRAVCAWAGPSGVIHAETAASLWLPGSEGRHTRLAHPTLRSRHRVLVHRKRIPPEFVRESGGIRYAPPAYVAVELAATDDGRAICQALRRRLATPAQLEAALAAMVGSRGQATRRCVVHDCLSNPGRTPSSGSNESSVRPGSRGGGGT